MFKPPLTEGGGFNKWHATRPLSWARRAGLSLLHGSKAMGQRGWSAARRGARGEAFALQHNATLARGIRGWRGREQALYRVLRVPENIVAPCSTTRQT
jgi:hypothetical protein